ncbi:hypothetical protein SAMN05192588_1739 [Nonlabens sp. Hel1_33_55]|uniref:DUF7033 domain-containing protein n=1 Tax=Nonlabens sp. Hel1_33_55 TaxID=1336802 RepID=UPI000875E032|nr:hypothetical protein [Nonlabens sp. Hel1_33_55]SCY22174.1 hypothetical protein SAMN05192588_1739 [Nonlabens sp. Hel1_33_55]
MILIYCPDLTSRKQYIFKHIFRRMLQVKYEVTGELNVFVGHEGTKFSYGDKPLGEETFIWSNGLLSEHGIDDHEIDIMDWDQLPAFFQAPERSDIPFDIFAASFYLITRYEEYFPQVKDDLGRYSPYESIAYKHDFLREPLIDLWVKKFAQLVLKLEISSLSRKRIPKKTIAIEVASFNKYRKRGVIVNATLFVRHVRNLRLNRAWKQLQTLLNLREDPYDNSTNILRPVKNSRFDRNKSRKHSAAMVFFFHLGNYNDFNTGVTYKSKSYVEAIKHIADYVKVGLRFSSNTSNEDVYQEEKRFEELVKRPLQHTMAANSKISMPGHYKLLVDTKTMEDYSMGYVAEPGFRASTSLPFYFYDLDYEVQTPLLIHPYCLHYNTMALQTRSGQQSVLKEIQNAVDNVGGNFIVQFHYEHFDLDIKSHALEILESIIDE